jgi:peptide/nickel transport system substrate-binding protein
MMRSQDEPFTLYGLIAESVELPDDRSFVTFHLNPKARFSDGHALTTEDVHFTFELLKKYGKPGQRRAFGQVKSVEITDPYKIRFDLSGANDRELQLLIAIMPIFPAHATNPNTFDKTSLTPPIGSGPYAITEVRPGERIVLKRREDYWGDELPISRGLYNFDEIRYDFYRDDNTMFEAFKVGLYDYRLEGDPGRWSSGYDFPAVQDGRVVRETVPIQLPKGMNGLVFNTRRAIFSDPRVREALGYMLDFEWLNRNLFYGLLQRSDSYFSGSELASTGHPADERERLILAGFPGAVRDDILEGQWRPPVSDGSGRDRELARHALSLLSDAGWTLENERLRKNGSGEPFTFEILVNTRQQERLALNYSQALQRIGVEARVRLVDDVQYWRRLSKFEYDMIQRSFGSSASPGVEQRNRWTIEAGSNGGAQNYSGATSPALDRLTKALLEVKSREDFVSSVRALDRVLLSGFYVVPLFYVGDQWLAYDSSLKRPPQTPMSGPYIDAWWRQPN